MTPQQLRALREGLRAFPDAGTLNPLQREFCRFYGIDFQDRLPGVEYRVGAVLSGACTLAVHRWLQAGAGSNLLLVHGYFDHSGLFAKLIEHGLSRGCNVVIFDLPGATAFLPVNPPPSTILPITDAPSARCSKRRNCPRCRCG